MKKLLIALLLLTPSFAFAAPYYTFQQTILPSVTAKWELGTTTKAWYRVFSNQFCLTGDTCISTWPTGSGGGSTFATSSVRATYPLSWNTTTATLSSATSSGSSAGVLSAADWTTFNNKQTAISLTTTGSSGASTFD